MSSARMGPVRAALASFLCLAAGAQAGLLPYASVQQMCLKSDLVVAGTHLGGGKVRVSRVFHAPDAAVEAGGSIEVPSIPRHTKVLGWSGKDGASIEADRVVLFLQQSGDGTLVPIYAVGSGSQGLFWLDDKVCYGYSQVMNPGPYRLVASRPDARRSRIPAGPAGLRARIDLGLRLRKRWEAIQAVEDRAERARRMAAYLLPRTAPQGYADSVDLRKAIRSLGADAVPALIDVLGRARADDNVNTTVLALYDIGGAHQEAVRKAVPALCRLLDNPPGRTSPYYILCPLTAAGDPRAVPHVRPMLERPSKQVRGQAARALAAMGDRASFESIAGLIEDPPKPQDHTGYTLELARALFELDPQRARPIIQRVESSPGNAGLHSFIAGYGGTGDRQK